MPRCKRKVGDSGFHHVVVKGDGGQVLFESDRHRKRFLALVQACSSEHSVEMHAYCLMDNHVHLLVRADACRLSAFMKNIDEAYAMYYSWVTKRTGHVFQGRFWSEPIESDNYYLAALRYIHANPEVAGICLLQNYPWSSYQAYLGKSSFVHTEFALELLGGADAFEALHRDGCCYASPYPNSRLNRHLASDELIRIAVAVLGEDTLRAIKSIKTKERAPLIKELSHAGLSVPEIVRITGLGRTVVRDALQQK